MSEHAGTTGRGSDAAARLQSSEQDAERARSRAAAAGRRAQELAGGARADPGAAAARAAQALQGLVASLRSSAEAHRRAARTHADAAALGSGDPAGHRAEAEHHLQRAEVDDARAAELAADDDPA